MRGFEQPARVGWTDERVDNLKALHKLGLSASQIAKQLGGVTRNAVIGKAVRMGLGPIGGGRASAPSAAKAQHGTLKAARPRQPAPKGVMILNPVKGGDVATAARVENMAAREKPAENVLQMARAFVPLPGCSPVGFGRGGCRWPTGGDGADMTQCGARRAEGERGVLPYCDDHSRAAFQPLKKGQPRTGNELARSLRRYAA